MPPITLHMVLARRVARALGDDGLATQEGPYLLGATTPDIRVLTRQDRLSTHFFDLNEHNQQDSVATFLREQERYANALSLNAETRAWAAGYLTHLALDEQYITGVYRRFFAAHEALGGRVRANVMDRLLQFDLDRAYGDVSLKEEICGALACTVENIDVAGFIEPETLERWRQVTIDIASRSMDWERMRGMVSNHLRFSGLEEGETLSSFLDSLPELLNDTLAHVTSAEVDAFIERATDAASRTVEGYLHANLS